MDATTDLLERNLETRPLDVEGVVAQLVARIGSAPVDTVPSDNIYMQDVFPTAVYQELLARMPADSVLNPIDHPDAITADGRITRRLLDLTEASLARFAAKDRPFWRGMMEVLTAPALTAAIVGKFQRTLNTRFGYATPAIVPVPLLYRDFPGYRIGIHPDAAVKIATFQLYLPPDDSQRHLGTTFHRRTIWGEIERYKTNIFAPNSAYAFVRTDDSLHSVDELGEGELPRNTLALTYYVSGKEYKSAAA
jgi:hypothetical protein